jgi:hypothetical protein
MRAFVNGELLGEDSLANMAWTFEELISFASRGSFVGPTEAPRPPPLSRPPGSGRSRRGGPRRVRGCPL